MKILIKVLRHLPWAISSRTPGKYSIVIGQLSNKKIHVHKCNTKFHLSCLVLNIIPMAYNDIVYHRIV